METKEHRLNIKNLEEDGTFTGYASVFGMVYLHQEVVAPGAFNQSLKKWSQRQQMPKMLWQHDPKIPIGVWLDIQEDPYGLYVKGKLLLDVRHGREAYALLKSGIVDGLSIGYEVVKAQRQSKQRVLETIELFEVSLVTFAANPAAKVTAYKNLDYRDDEARILVRLRGLAEVM
ncbi:HK97 family phage prohead protease [Candidatus Finniella inopinata]|uniref:HK97 family phage prohead protease n=1 Tax=Candidatus Finniella inopinata TaxID=1696036 RepID=A0A4Q7DNT0_9PROT|nr:HK97 family phage prohead protease [Candidatus Finniella inopinata]RZI46576.1 HK97 family phage prohead protease [Candidatus Finniella inopinata]